MLLLRIIFTLSTFALANSQVTTGQLGDATMNLDDPMGAAYQAVIPAGKYGNIKGSIVAVSAGDKGTEFAVDFSGLPSEGGPFVYHIHVDPVPADGNCNGTLAHLDPFLRGEDTPCTSDRPETCQVGDLAGKHGKANGTSHKASYTDPYVSLKDGVGAFFGNRSFVVHFANKTRIACANFSSISNAQDGNNPGAGLIGNQPSNATATLVPANNKNNLSATATMMTSSTPSPAIGAKPAQATSNVATRDVANGLLLLAAFAVGLWSFL